MHTYSHTRKMSMMADVYHLSMSENGQKTHRNEGRRERRKAGKEIDNESHHLAVKVKTKSKENEKKSAHTSVWRGRKFFCLSSDSAFSLKSRTLLDNNFQLSLHAERYDWRFPAVVLFKEAG